MTAVTNTNHLDLADEGAIPPRWLFWDGEPVTTETFAQIAMRRYTYEADPQAGDQAGHVRLCWVRVEWPNPDEPRPVGQIYLLWRDEHGNVWKHYASSQSRHDSGDYLQGVPRAVLG